MTRFPRLHKPLIGRELIGFVLKLLNTLVLANLQAGCDCRQMAFSESTLKYTPTRIITDAPDGGDHEDF